MKSITKEKQRQVVGGKGWYYCPYCNFKTKSFWRCFVHQQGHTDYHYYDLP